MKVKKDHGRAKSERCLRTAVPRIIKKSDEDETKAVEMCYYREIPRISQIQTVMKT